MRDIQTDGAPTAVPRPASTERTRRRVMGTGAGSQGNEGERHEAIYGVPGPNLEQGGKFDAPTTRLELTPLLNTSTFKYLQQWRGLPRAAFLDFPPLWGFNPGTSRKDVLFDPPPGP